MTNRRAKALFASGNMASSFLSFERTHECNKFCEFFEIPSDYNTWPDMIEMANSTPGEDEIRDSDMEISQQ